MTALGNRIGGVGVAISMNAAHLLRALVLAVAVVGAAVAACTQGPGGASTIAPGSPAPAAATEAPSASPSSSGGNGGYDY